MSHMEEDSSRLLRKIIQTIFLSILWLLFIVTMGIYNAWFFFGAAPTPGNYIFYGIALLTGFLLVRYLIRLWRNT